jgi:hypothetical protein
MSILFSTRFMSLCVPHQSMVTQVGSTKVRPQTFGKIHQTNVILYLLAVMNIISTDNKCALMTIKALLINTKW